MRDAAATEDDDLPTRPSSFDDDGADLQGQLDLVSRPVGRVAVRRLPSLRARMVRRVLVPLAVVWLVGASIAIAIGSHSTESAFDRALLDDALGLAASVTMRDEALRVDLSADELVAVLFDQSEAVHYAVRDAHGVLIAGEPGLVADNAVITARPAHDIQFADLELEHEPLRAVLLQRETPKPFSVVLAQTTRNRSAQVNRMLLYALTPLVLLLLLLGWWIGRTIEADLHPIVELQDELNRREGADLQPLAIRANTQDVDRLVTSANGLMSRLRTLIAAQREFSGNVAHELRTPLAGIRALAEFGLASKDNPALWRQQLQAIVRSQERASRLVDQLLALALADEADSAPALVPVALDDIVQRVLLRSMHAADAAGVDLGAEGIDEPVVVQGDEGLIEGALQNLVDNALRYGRPPDGTPPSITVAVRLVADGRVELSVTDNGPGFPPSAGEHLLHRWRQGDIGRQLGEGAGLGLAIVSRYATLLGANFDIEPGMASGSRARLTFGS